LSHTKDIPSEKLLFDAADALRGSVESGILIRSAHVTRAHAA
jgi:hypothetical protein